MKLPDYIRKTRRTPAADAAAIRNVAARYNRLGGANARGFDATNGTSMAFLVSQLEVLDPNPVKPLQAVTHPRDITVKTGGGFPEWVSAWAVDYASSGGGNYGLQATNNSEIAEAQGNITKGQWPVYTWAGAFTISYLDLKRMETAKKIGNAPPPISLQKLYDDSIETVWLKALDYVTYLGFNGGAGLVNNPNVPAAVASPTGTANSPAWSAKTATQILNDVNFGINQTVINSGYDIQQGAADTMLIPYTQFALLTQPMVIGGVGYDSTLSYIKKNCVAASYGVDFNIYPLPNPWISSRGLGTTDRAVFYKNTEDNVMLQVPAPKMLAYTVPNATGTPGYRSFFVGAVSSVMFKRTVNMFYMDAV